MPIYQQLTKGRVPVKIYTDEVEPSALEQLRHIADLPFIHHHVAAMPDVHMGIGATIGSVIPTRGAIIPAAVGVDIGCGMNALRLSLTADRLPDNLAKVRGAIERAVPVGFDMHARDPVNRSTITALGVGLERIMERHRAIARMQAKHSFCSCSHGAGRRMSRTEAKRRFTAHDLEAQTVGVECRKDRGVVDEIPGAYKDIDRVMANQADLVEVVHRLKQVVCVKG